MRMFISLDLHSIWEIAESSKNTDCRYDFNGSNSDHIFISFGPGCVSQGDLVLKVHFRMEATDRREPICIECAREQIY